MIIGFIFLVIIFSIIKDDLKKWEKISLFFLIITTLLFFATSIMNNINETIWQICKTLFWAMITVEIASLFLCLFLAIKNNEQLATWIKVILVINIIVGGIVAIGQVSLNRETTVMKNYSQYEKFIQI